VRKLGVVVLALAAGACASGPSEPGGVSERSETGTATSAGERVGDTSLARSTRCEGAGERPLGGARASYVAAVLRRTSAHAGPGEAVLHSFGRMNVNGVPTVFGVRAAVFDEECEPAWYRVQLPIRPNGATGYVRARAVALYRITTRIEIDLSKRRLDFFRGGERVLRAAVAIGSRATPTPTGRYYVNQRLRSRDPSGPYGPAALGVSAFSNVLTGWTQGGPIAVHGTNDPGSIGKAVSNGCLRLPNQTLLRLYEATPAGTPVVIRR
jgi:lipoprotein-anchoring transpeptidase ErfK/SrfK